MENQDGTPLDITTDFLGHSINKNIVVPGPFQNIKSFENKLKVWPKVNNTK